MLTITGPRVYLRPPRRADAPAFLAAAKASRVLHGRWTRAPETAARYMAYVERFAPRGGAGTHAGFLVFRRSDNALVGVFNFSEIVKGAFAEVGKIAQVPSIEAARRFATNAKGLSYTMAGGKPTLTEKSRQAIIKALTE